MFVKDMNAG